MGHRDEHSQAWGRKGEVERTLTVIPWATLKKHLSQDFAWGVHLGPKDSGTSCASERLEEEEPQIPGCVLLKTSFCGSEREQKAVRAPYTS